MDLYRDISYKTSKLFTERYSTSFSSSTKLFAKTIQPHIYAIYGLVRIADEIVDTYRGSDALEILNELEHEVCEAIERRYSTNPIVHAFALTASRYTIDTQLIKPFFDSMRMDLAPETYDTKKYTLYIYGSAEVIGLMCLLVFVDGDKKAYNALKSGAQSLGAAYQKINFLRDLAADHTELGRIYFPGVSFDSFDDTTKDAIIRDIEKDIEQAKLAVARLPRSSQRAVGLSLAYYEALLKKLKRTSADVIKQRRIRISRSGKIKILANTRIRERLSREA